MASNKMAVPQTDLQIVTMDTDFAKVKEAAAKAGETITVRDFTKLKVPSGTSAAVFCLESIDGEQTPATIDCIILEMQPINVYFDTPYDGTVVPPTCVANDGITGIGTPGGDCARCPLNEFGTGKDGQGKACSNRRHLLALIQGEIFPLFINVPPTSVKALRTYILNVIKKTLAPSEVITKIGLKKVTSNTNMPYYEMDFSYVATLDENQLAIVQKYQESLSGMLAEQALNNPSVHTEGRAPAVDVAAYETPISDEPELA